MAPAGAAPVLLFMTLLGLLAGSHGQTTPANPTLFMSLSTVLTYAESSTAAAVTIDGGITVTSASGNTFASVTIAISQGFDASSTTVARDKLLLTVTAAMAGVTISSAFSDTTGSMTLTVAAGTADSVVQAALRAVQYQNTATDSYLATKLVLFTVTDAAAKSATGTRTIAYAAVNALAVLGGLNADSASPPTQRLVVYAKTSSSTAVILQPSLSLTYSERANIASAQITLAAGYDSADDIMELKSTAATAAASAGVVAVWNTTQALPFLSLTGSASVATYQTLLRGVQLRHTGLGNSGNYNRTITWAVTDANTALGSHTTLPLTQVVLSTYNLRLPALTALASAAPTTAGNVVVTFTGTNLGFGGLTGGLGTFIIMNDKTQCPATTVSASVSNGVTTSSYDTCTSNAGLVQKVTVGTSTCTGITLTVPFTTLTCTVAAGSGSGIFVSVKVANQNSDTSTAVAFFTYANPTITSVTVSGGSTVSGGGGTVTVTGTNFGPTAAGLQQSAGGAITFGSLTTPVQTAVTYTVLANNFASTQYPPFVCSNPVMTTAHQVFTCTMPAGVGKNLDVVVTAAGLSANKTSALSYAAPTVTAVTKGSPFGYFITITGTNFGPVTASTGVGTNVAVNISTSSVWFSCLNPYVSVINTQIICTTPAANTIGNGLIGIFSGDTNIPSTHAAYSVQYDVQVTAGIFDTNYLPVGNLQSFTGSSLFQLEPPILTSIVATDDSNTGGKLNMFGGMVSITGRNFGPVCTATGGTAPGSSCSSTYTAAKLIFTDYQLVNATTGTYNTTQWVEITTTVTATGAAAANTGATLRALFVSSYTFPGTVVNGPAVTTSHTTIQAYVPDYVSTGGLMNPQVQVGVLYYVNTSYPVYLTTALGAANLTYEPPVVTGFIGVDGKTSGIDTGVGGAQFGGDSQWDTNLVFGMFRIIGRNFGLYKAYVGAAQSPTSATVSTYMSVAYFTKIHSGLSVGSGCTFTDTFYPYRGTLADNAVVSSHDPAAFTQIASIKDSILSTATLASYLGIFIGGKEALGLGPVTTSTLLCRQTTTTAAVAGYQRVAVVSDTVIEFTSSAANFSNPISGTNLTVSIATLCTGTTLSTCQVSTCKNCNTTGAGRFDYLGPVISSVGRVATTGGTLSIVGKRFGIPTGGGLRSAPDGVTVCSEPSCSVSGGSLNCTSFTITAETGATCVLAAATSSANFFVGVGATATISGSVVTISAGSVSAAAVNVSLGGLSAALNQSFVHALPTITAINTTTSSRVATVGGTITIYGANFGPIGAASVTVNVTVPSGASTTQVVGCTNATVTTDHTRMTCTAPAGTGANNPVLISLSNNGGSQASAPTSLLSYALPNMTSSTSSLTSGGLINITGSSFGPACAGCAAFTFTGNAGLASGGTATTTVKAVGDVLSDTSMSVTMVPGYGTLTAAQFQATIPGTTGQSATTSFSYSYLAPTIQLVAQPPSIFGSSVLLINGTSFGPKLAVVTPTISISQVAAANFSACTVTVAHVQVSCPVVCNTPCTANYATSPTTNSTMVLTVAGLTGNVSSAILLFEGPVILGVRGSKTAIAGQMSFLAGSYRTAAGAAQDQLVIEGRNFGAVSGSDGSSLYAVQLCYGAASSTCWASYSASTTLNASSTMRTAFSTYSATLTSLLGGYSACTATYSNYPCTAEGTNVGSVVAASFPDPFAVVNAWSVRVVVNGSNVLVDSGATGDSALSFVGPKVSTVSNTDPTLGDVGTGLVGNGNTPACLTGGYPDPTTEGGILVLCGTRLGTDALFAASKNNIRVDDRWDTLGNINSGATGNVVAVGINDTQVNITVPAGVGRASFVLSVTNAASTPQTLSTTPITLVYSRPVITSVSALPTSGGIITIVGTSFGPTGSLGQPVPLDANLNPVVVVQIYYGTTTPQVRGSLLGVCTGVTIVTAHTKLTCTAPKGIGSGYWVVITVAGAANAANNQECALVGGTSGNTTSCPGAAFAATALTGMTQVPTSGGLLYINGTSLGPAITTADSGVSVLFSSPGQCTSGNNVCACSGCVACPGALVIGSGGNLVSCNAPPGYGGPFDTVLQLGTAPNVATAVLKSTSNFLAYQNPTITGISPSVSFFGGSTITISGTNFGCSGGTSAAKCGSLPFTAVLPQVLIGPNALPCTSVQVTTPHTQITCVAPAYLDAATLTNVSVAVLIGGVSKTATTGIIGPKFSQSIYAPTFYVGPQLTSVTTVSIFGGPCNITGTNFGPAVNGSITMQGDGASILPGAILINNAAIDIVASAARVLVDQTLIAFTAPAGSGKNLPLQVSLRGASSNVIRALNYIGPRIDSISGCTTAGGLVTIYGRNFGPLGTANFVDATNASVTPTIVIPGLDPSDPLYPTLTCTSPTVTVVETTTTLGALTCTFAIPGLDVTGYGTYTGAWDVSLTMGGDTTPAVKAGWPSGCTGASTTCLGGGLGAFTYAAPVVTSLTPTTGGAGTLITITGTSFGNNASAVQVYVGAKNTGGVYSTYNYCLNVTITTAHTTIRCAAPRWAGVSQDVTVVVNGQASAASASAKFSYSAPVVTSISSAPTAGGTVTITGTFFGPAGGPTVVVQLGTYYTTAGNCISAAVTVDDTTITCTARTAMPVSQLTGSPAATTAYYNDADLAGTGGNGVMPVNITINGQAANGSLTFSFLQPAVTTVLPRVARYTDLVTVTGTNLGPSNTAILVKVGKTSAGMGSAVSVNTSKVAISSSTANTAFTFQMPLGTGVANSFWITINGRAVNTSALNGTTIAFDTPQFITPLLSGISLVGGVQIPAGTTLVGAPLAGGTTAVRGRGFGPVGTPVTSVSVNNGTAITCSNPTVTVDDTVLNCTMPSGTGGPYNITAVIDGQSSGTSGAFAWAYQGSQLGSVVPKTNITAGTLLTITANQMSGISLSFISVIISDRIIDQPLGIGLPCTNVTWVVVAQSISCIAPLSVGFNLDVIVIISSVFSVRTSASLISYRAPVITSVLPAATDGLSPVTIIGTGFGPVTDNSKPGVAGLSSYFDSVIVNSANCTSANVTVADTVVTCFPPPGSDVGYDVVVTMRGASTGTSGFKKFSYLPPNVTGIIPPPVTYGGVVTILGNNFGPAGTAAATNATVTLYDGENVLPNCTASTVFAGNGGCVPNLFKFGPCTDVAVASHYAITCNVKHGYGWHKDIKVKIKSLDSNVTGAKIFHYTAPQLTGITPKTPSASGTLMTITGLYFGYDYEYRLISVRVNGVLCDPLDQISQYVLSQRSSDYTTYLDAATIVVRAPYTTGSNLPVQVALDGQWSSLADNVTFSYSQPMVTGATQVDTIGGSITVTGINFGPVGTPATVTIGGLVCANAVVVTLATQILCTMPPGTGANKTIIVGTGPVGNQIYSLGLASEGTYSYNAPYITQITPVYAAAGDLVTVLGNNFGFTPSLISIGLQYPASVPSLGSGAWMSEKPVTPGANSHVMFLFVVPFGFSHDLTLQLTVDGQTRTSPSNVKFTYSPPAVISSTPVPSSGGVVTVTGINFGPAGSPSVDFVDGIDWVGSLIPCTSPVVITNNTQLTCNMAAGVGQNLGLQLSVGQLTSAIFGGTFKYNPPIVRNVFPVYALAGDLVNVTGENFGTKSQLVQVTVGGLFSTAQVTVTQAHTNLSFIMPNGAGKNLFVSVNVPVGNNVSSLAAQTTQAIKPASGQSVTISYISPIIYSTSAAPTNGGVITIYGINFGPVGNGNINTVLVNSAICGNPNVTVSNTQLQCVVVAGSGLSKAVLVNLGAQTSIGGETAYNYAPPVVTAILPATASPGDIVTVSGSSFGADATKVSIMLGSAPCLNPAYVTPHILLTCTVPISSGRNISVQMTVDNNKGNATFGLFGYTVAGCLNPVADNYNPQATSAGNCTISGCTRPTAYNFRAVANTDDGSCVNPPTQVVLTMSLPFTDYLSNPSYYRDQVAVSVASNLGINKTRVVNITAVSGSTIFTFYITDDPKSPAAAAVATLQSQVINNEFTMTGSLGTLLSLALPTTPNAPTLQTAATQALRFSAASIGGIVAGVVFLLIWIVFWRRILLFITSRCCKPREGDDASPGRSKAYEADTFEVMVEDADGKPPPYAVTAPPKGKPALKSLREQHGAGFSFGGHAVSGV